MTVSASPSIAGVFSWLYGPTWRSKGDVKVGHRRLVAGSLQGEAKAERRRPRRRPRINPILWGSDIGGVFERRQGPVRGILLSTQAILI